MTVHELGNPVAEIVLIQPVGDHDLSELEEEVTKIAEGCAQDFCLLAVQVADWNCDLSPWKAPAVFGKDAFGDGAPKLLEEILQLCSDKSRRYYLGGYSLGGLFALWAACQTDAFAGVAAASPSVWFPDFVAYLDAHPVRCPAVYLSLGDREARTRNPVMAKVADCIQACEAILRGKNIACTLEWNPGNHFQDPAGRTARGFSWLLNQKESISG